MSCLLVELNCILDTARFKLCGTLFFQRFYMLRHDTKFIFNLSFLRVVIITLWCLWPNKNLMSWLRGWLNFRSWCCYRFILSNLFRNFISDIFWKFNSLIEVFAKLSQSFCFFINLGRNLFLFFLCCLVFSLSDLRILFCYLCINLQLLFCYPNLLLFCFYFLKFLF